MIPHHAIDLLRAAQASLSLYAALTSVIQISIAVLLASTAINAQETQLYFHHLNTANGLSQSFCSFVYKDSTGFVWISSIDGLMRYDGQTIQSYRPKTGNPHALNGKNVQSPFFEDARGDLWFSTYDAINVYRRKTDDFEHFFIQKNGQKIQDASYNILFFERGRRLAVLVNNKELYWVSPDKADGRQHTIGQAYAGEATGNRCCLLSCKDKGPVTTFFTFSRASHGKPGFNQYAVVGDSIRQMASYFDGSGKWPALYVKAIVCDPQNILWLSTHVGLIRFEPGSGRWQQFNQINPFLIFGSSEGLAEDGSDWLWVSTDLGLAHFNKKKGQFESFYKIEADGANGPAATTSELYLDRHRVLWCSIMGTGVDFTALDKPKFDKFPVPDDNGKPFIPAALEEDGWGNIWVGSNIHRLKRYTRKGAKAGTWTTFPDKTWALHKMSDGRLFVATMKEISYVFDPVSDKKHPVKTSDGADITFWDVCRGPNKTLLGAPLPPNDGIWKIEKRNEGYIAARLPTSLFSGAGYSRIFLDDTGQLFAVKDFKSLVIYRIQDTTATFVKKTTLLGEAKSFYETKQHVWVGGEFGLCRIDKKSHEEILLDEQKGLPNNTVYGILPDGTGHLWLSTNRGIIRFNIAEQQFREFSLADGLQNYEFNTKSYLKTTDGLMWFGGIKGINVFAPEKIQDLTVLPNVVVTKLFINGVLDTTRQNICLRDSLYFSHDQNTLAFEFAALEYSDPARNKLSFRLYYASGKAFDDNWVINKSALGSARYPNLAPGSYILHIQGANSDGQWNPVHKLIYFKIKPPFYQTSLFIFLMVVLAIILGILIFRAVLNHNLRLKNLQLREQRVQIEKQDALTQERNRIAAEMHDDFGSGLTAIQRLSERAGERTETPDIKQSMETITRYSLELISNMREIIWAMSGKNDNLENLMAYISENAYNYLTSQNIDVDIIQPEEIPLIEMTGERRRNIYLAVKESLHNIVKHAQATQATITFETNGTLDIRVQDNGKGFKNHNLAGNGMNNMAKRMRDIGGTLTVINNQGTHLIFSVPIEKK